MSGGIAMAVILVVIFPVVFMLIGAAIAIVLGLALTSPADPLPEHEGDDDAGVPASQ